jgi:hypothetical protein
MPTPAGPVPSADTLRRLYVDDRMSMHQIAAVVGVGLPRLRGHFREYGIPMVGRRHCGPPTEERFYDSIEPEPNSGCWLFALGGPRGYGYLSVGGRGGRRVLAHRFSYELHVGPVPEGLVLDHLCRVRRCVNPRHLEPVTQRENVFRGAVTKRFDEIPMPGGGR